uniref:Uncharacterized protein n=1 Tax=Physcomitrium patens TaxID=3218 RepID=A0A2K1KJS2_PHYPA|nr:hypothetical protein PHYPA_007702 [Physcomitrium patens]
MRDLRSIPPPVPQTTSTSSASDMDFEGCHNQGSKFPDRWFDIVAGDVPQSGLNLSRGGSNWNPQTENLTVSVKRKRKRTHALELTLLTVCMLVCHCFSKLPLPSVISMLKHTTD